MATPESKPASLFELARDYGNLHPDHANYPELAFDALKTLRQRQQEIALEMTRPLGPNQQCLISNSLIVFLISLSTATDQGKLKFTQLEDIETLCQGVVACRGAVNRTLLGPMLKKELSGFTATLLNIVHERFQAQADAHPDQLMNIQFWPLVALSENLLEPTDAIRASCGKSLRIVANSTHKPATLEYLAQCANQVSAMMLSPHKLIDIKDPEVVQNLKDVAKWLCSEQSCAIVTQTPSQPHALNQITSFLHHLNQMGIINLQQANLAFVQAARLELNQ